MKNRIFSTDQPKGLIRQNSDVNLDKNDSKNKEVRQVRQMKSVNKQIGTKKKHFFFQEGQKIVGDYKFDVRKQIGTGYSSKVYKAINIKDNLQYAIKAVQLSNFKPSHFEMLENEIKILKKVSHPNVIKFYNVSQTSSHLYIITEFCQKGDLLTFMTRKGVVSENQALKIFSDILKGMQYLQKFGIIHRDIKPGNILYDGKNWKIADFGFSLQSKEQVRTRNNVGTPLYMPLESLQKNTYSPQSDIFSVGVVLYELLVGITPWECRDEEELIKKLNNIQFKIPQKIVISSQIKQLLKRMCQPFKQNRMTRKQFLSLQPQIFQNFMSTSNVFKNNSLEQSKKEINFSQIKKQVISKKITGEFKLNDQQEKQQMKQRNETNLFANGKMKRSSQNVKIERQTTIKQLSKIKSASNLFSSLQPQAINNQQSQVKSAALRQKIEKTNRNILLSMLNFCRFMFYLMKNGDYLELNEPNKQKIKTILMKHSLMILKQLSDTQNNWFRLQSYDYYKETRNYYKLYSSFQQYLTKYQKEYQTLIKKVDSTVVKEINQKLSEFNKQQLTFLGQAFHKKLLSYIAPILRQNNHNLASQIFNNKKKPTDQTNFKIQAIKHFLKYYRLVQTLSKQTQNFQNFQQTNIDVVKSYQQTTATIQDFMNLRKLMKYI